MVAGMEVLDYFQDQPISADALVCELFAAMVAAQESDAVYRRSTSLECDILLWWGLINAI